MYIWNSNNSCRLQNNAIAFWLFSSLFIYTFS
ncbi:MAG: hypothetical protein KF872_10890 [Chitinophagales bacterium]|nr:hypothetical protein [Chitinophagales bacterium]